MALTQITEKGIKDGEIINADINASAAIARSKLANVDVVDDTSPQLGGDLDLQARTITTSTANGNIKLLADGTGVIEVRGIPTLSDGSSRDGTVQLNCSQNSHSIKIKSPAHSAAASYTLTLPENDGNANQVLKTDGSGVLSWVDQTTDTNTVTTINNNADNRVITGSGTANTLEGESGFTHNPSTQDTQIDGSSNAPVDLIIANTNNTQSAATARISVQAGDNANNGGQLELECNGQYHGFESRSNGNLYISDNGTTKLTLDSNGHLAIADGDLQISTAGHGIDFSAQTASSATGATSGAEILDHYEEGTWTPTTSIGAMHTMHGAHYTKIGRLVNCQCYVTMPTSSASTHVRIDNFPFTSLGSNHYGIGAAYCQWQGNDHFFFQMSPSATHGYPHVGLGNAVTHATASGVYYLMSVTYFTA